MVYVVRIRRREYSRTDSGKSWRTNPDFENLDFVTVEQYENMTSDDWIKTFRNMGGCYVKRGYTPYKYCITRMIRHKPDDIKVVEDFSFVPLNVDNMTYEERNLIRNAKYVSRDNERRDLVFTDYAGNSVTYGGAY